MPCKEYLQGICNFTWDTFFNVPIKLPSSLGCHTLHCPTSFHIFPLFSIAKSLKSIWKQNPLRRVGKENQLLHKKLDCLWHALGGKSVGETHCEHYARTIFIWAALWNPAHSSHRQWDSVPEDRTKPAWSDSQNQVWKEY